MTETWAAVRGEWAKLRCVRGTWVTLLLFAVVSVLLAALAGRSTRAAIESESPLLRADFTPEQAGFDAVLYGQPALIAFGVLMVAGEYGSGGLMRVSLLAVPRRGRLFAAKTLVIGAATIAVAAPVTALSYLTTQRALGPHGAPIDAPGVPGALAGAVVYLTLMALFAAGIAMTARNAVVPLAILLPMVLVGTHLLSLLGATKDLVRYFPDRAGAELLTVASSDAPTGLAVLVTWTAAALACGYVRHSRWE